MALQQHLNDRLHRSQIAVNLHRLGIFHQLWHVPDVAAAKQIGQPRITRHAAHHITGSIAVPQPRQQTSRPGPAPTGVGPAVVHALLLWFSLTGSKKRVKEKVS